MFGDGIGATIGELAKQATAHKRAGNLEEALRCAKEAHEMKLASETGGFSEEGWTKYPLYLQRAGRYDEAIAVFEHILDAAEAIVAKDFPDGPPFMVRGYAQNLRIVVLDKMRVAAQREKRPEDVERFRVMRSECVAAFIAFEKVRDMHRKRERAQYDERKRQRSTRG